MQFLVTKISNTTQSAHDGQWSDNPTGFSRPKAGNNFKQCDNVIVTHTPELPNQRD